KKQRAAYEEIYRSLLNGMALSDSMEKLGGVFPELLINMYRAGEANGTLDQTANRMAEHYEKEQRLKSKLKSASTYPMILMCLTIAVMVLIFTVVLPKFLALYGDAPLPAITQAVVGISILFTQHTLGLIIGILLIIFTLMSIYRLPKVRYKVDKLKLKVFIIGKLMRTVYTARFARTLSSLYSSGLSILTALQICRGTIGNAYIAAQFEDLIKNVRNGSALSESVEQIDGYDKKLSSTILIGEESGQLEHMLLAVADSFDYESEQATARLSSMLEPILIILMALLVGTVIFSVMLPIIQMYGNMGL
ncbi:MAG: type II secretion system F family protein, partial [Clostridia bacterium]|nr:type II secretion system F family protein [Clostridia bacterium]